MNFRFTFKRLFTEPKWFFRFGIWQWLSPKNLYIYYIRFPYQKLTRGFTDEELWNLDYTIAKFVLPRLREFAKNPVGFPCSHIDSNEHEDKECYERWKKILAKIIRAMELTIDESEGKNFSSDEDYKKILKEKIIGMRLFGRYFNSLWE